MSFFLTKLDGAFMTHEVPVLISKVRRHEKCVHGTSHQTEF